MIDPTSIEVVADPLDHPEGIAVATDGTVFAGGEVGQLYRFRCGEVPEIVADSGGWLLGLCVDVDGTVLACDCERRQVLRLHPSDGRVEVWCESARGAPLTLPNAPVLLADGSLLVSDSGSEWGPADGRILRVPAGGGDASVLDTRPLDYANGIAVATDGTILVAETHAARVAAIGPAGATIYASLPESMPDGLLLDAEGGLLICCFQPNAIFRVPAGPGAVTTLVSDWSGRYLLSPTNMAFAADDRHLLLVATLLGWSIRAARVPVPGPDRALRPVVHPALRWLPEERLALNREEP